MTAIVVESKRRKKSMELIESDNVTDLTMSLRRRDGIKERVFSTFKGGFDVVAGLSWNVASTIRRYTEIRKVGISR